MRCISLLYLFILSVSCPCLAAKVSVKNTKPMIIPVDTVTPKITQADVEKLVPLEMAKTSTSSNILTRIADRGFSMWFNSAAIKDSALGRAAEKTQEKLKTDVVIQEGAGDNSVKHKFSMRLEAFQAMAKLEYSGWMKANVNYDASRAQTNFEIKEKAFGDKDLVVSHKASSKEALSMVGLNWNF